MAGTGDLKRALAPLRRPPASACRAIQHIKLRITKQAQCTEYDDINSYVKAVQGHCMERIQELSACMLPVPSPVAALPSAQDMLRMINQLQQLNFEQADKLRMAQE